MKNVNKLGNKIFFNTIEELIEQIEIDNEDIIFASDKLLEDENTFIDVLKNINYDNREKFMEFLENKNIVYEYKQYHNSEDGYNFLAYAFNDKENVNFVFDSAGEILEICNDEETEILYDTIKENNIDCIIDRICNNYDKSYSFKNENGEYEHYVLDNDEMSLFRLDRNIFEKDSSQWGYDIRKTIISEDEYKNLIKKYNDKDLINCYVKDFGEEVFSDNKELISKKIKEDGIELAFASPRLQDNAQIVLKACENNKEAFKFASPRLQDKYSDVNNFIENMYKQAKQSTKQEDEDTYRQRQ